MWMNIFIGLGVLMISVVIQVLGVLSMLRYLGRRMAQDKLGQGLWGDVIAMSTVMSVLFIGHLVQIGIWAKLFIAIGEFPDYTTAFYHSAVNFASLGYGDMVMSEEWRLLGALEAGNGVLMFGLSAAAMYALVIKLIDNYRE